jgi:hypothetical protein
MNINQGRQGVSLRMIVGAKFYQFMYELSASIRPIETSNISFYSLI